MSGTREKLIAGSLTAIREHGIAGTSARSIAAAAGVNQALIFYHFGTVDELLSAACQTEATARVDLYRSRFASVKTLRELLDVGRDLHEREKAEGNVTVLAQLMAGAQNDEKLAGPTAAALALWTAEIEAVLRRVLVKSPLSDLADPAGLAVAVSAAFVGLELYDGVDPDGARGAFAALEQLAVVAEVVDDLGPIARRALRARLRSSGGAR
ncbi:TetR/AcrR family transcriptional regulator [Paractinoplanes durhamensis]|uniref:TetR family transcriptional regulator n=1 Tax=Paractinoplanes durhamensis TaxID=113563 RepID=A0ABQ3YT86_9ACTN|nr:TetR/AcrR family transcriptional regulator [Actinoplanes durhamensis]GIE00730.1 TetR family transcriptional regulator [Actinoplanes durhamensis]